MSNSRRELLQALVFAPLPLLAPRARSVTSPLNGYPLPEFAIGDLVALDWADDDDNDDLGSGTDFGKIVGLRWVGEDKQYLATSPLPANSWVYFVCWTHNSTGDTYCYPCYDEDPYPACELRCVKHG